MRNPLDPRFQKITRLMQTGEMIGTDRPVGRVTWTKTPVRRVKSAKPGEGFLRYINKHHEKQHELPGIRTIDIDRSIGQDAATCTITLYNYRSGARHDPEGVDTEGTVGYYTPGRGDAKRNGQVSIYRDADGPYPTSWGYQATPYRDVFIPNTILRTYQGYGSDNLDEWGEHRAVFDPEYVEPEDDTQLYLTGVWLIDKVTFGGDATISVECRDLAKLLIEQYVYPPMIPINRFPLVYTPGVQGHPEKIGRNVATFGSSSADRRYGFNAPVHGHRGAHAFTATAHTFWLSPGNDSPDGYEWLQAHISGPINEVVLHTVTGNHVAYISVHEKGKWQGTHDVPSSAEGDSEEGYLLVISRGDTLWDLAGTHYGNNLLWPRIAHANDNIIADPHWIYPGQKVKIPYITGTRNPPPAGQASSATKKPIKYVKRVTIPKSNKPLTIKLPRLYDAKHLRVTITQLQKDAPTPTGSAHRSFATAQARSSSGMYRAGIRHLAARNHISFLATTIGKAGYITDWSEPIKELCAWAGFTWPDAGRANKADPILGHSVPPRGATGNDAKPKPLRVWGDFELLGAGPIVPTDGDYFLNKSFMEAVRQIVDFIGAIFYVDETGGAQFRLTNIWGGGNFIADPEAPASLAARISYHPIEFNDEANLTSYSMIIDDQALRSEILVVGAEPTNTSSVPVAGGYVTGYNPVTGTTSAIDFTNILAGQYRLMAVPGESTKLFKTERECQRMAELTALFILFTYRQGTLSAPAHPGLQIDDQVPIYERVTNEQNIHYVSGIASHQDLESGEYTMNVTTHWLGKDPRTHWFVNKAQLTPAVKRLPAILKRAGTADVGETDPNGVLESS